MKKNQLNRIPLKSILLYLSLALFLSMGVTFSKYITSSGGEDAARVAAFGGHSIYETVDGERVTKQNIIYAPGVDIIKNPAVDFKSNELSAYVFVKIDADKWSFNSADDSFAILNKGEERLKWSVDIKEWSKVPVEDERVYYIYVPAGSSLSGVPIIEGDKITVSSSITNSELTEIQSIIGDVSFTSFAAQANGFEDALSAWRAISK